MGRKRQDQEPRRGGSHTARLAGLIGIVVHVTPEERTRIRTVAGAAGLSSKEYARRSILHAAERDMRKIPKDLA
jgi:hypothetical protein